MFYVYVTVHECQGCIEVQILLPLCINLIAAVSAVLNVDITAAM